MPCSPFAGDGEAAKAAIRGAKAKDKGETDGDQCPAGGVHGGAPRGIRLEDPVPAAESTRQGDQGGSIQMSGVSEPMPPLPPATARTFRRDLRR
jgi:hypothetical protein